MRLGCGKKLIDVYSPTPDEIDAALDLYGLYRSERDALLTSGKIAMLGAQGINPTKKYALKCLPNRGEIYGEEVLAYYFGASGCG